MERIAIIRLSSLGDIVHALPVLPVLRRNRPQCHITWFAEPAGAELLGHFPGIDEIARVDVKGCRSLPAKVAYLVRFARRWRGHFDLVLDFQGLLKSALIAFLLGGTRLGFGRGNLREPLAALFYSRRADPFPEERHVIRKNLHLLSPLGIESAEVEYPRRPWRPSEALIAFLKESGLGEGGWIVLNVGGGWPSKLLNEEQWHQVAEGLKRDGRLVLLWGNEREKKSAEVVARRSGVRLAPFMRFGDLIYFIAHAQLVISADTLALHLADLTGTTAVGVFGPTSPQRNGPLLPASRSIHHQLECSFCYRRRCGTMHCLRDIAIEDIIHAARAIDGQRD